MEIISFKNQKLKIEVIEDVVIAKHRPNSFWCMGRGKIGLVSITDSTGTYPISLWSIEENQTFCIDGIQEKMLDSPVKRVSLCDTAHLMIVLTHTGSLYLWDTDS